MQHRCLMNIMLYLYLRHISSSYIIFTNTEKEQLHILAICASNADIYTRAHTRKFFNKLHMEIDGEKKYIILSRTKYIYKVFHMVFQNCLEDTQQAYIVDGTFLGNRR